MSPEFEQAEQLRKAGRCQEALEIFLPLSERRASASLAWRIAYCLRKLGRLEEAENFARQALQQFPDDQYIASELGWVLYERYFKSVSPNLSLHQLDHIAKEILELAPENEVLTERVALQMMKHAKQKGQWRVVLEWAERINPESLSNERREMEQGTVMSERESYYIAYSRALIETEQFDPATRVVQETLQQFPDSLFLKRNLALAYEGLSDFDNALAILRDSLSHPRADWYLRQDLARIESKSGNPSLAYRIYCEILIDLSRRQSLEYLVGLLEEVGYVACSLEKWEAARHYATLAYDVREQNGWSTPESLSNLLQRIRRTLQSQNQSLNRLPQDRQQLLSRCKQFWREESPIRQGVLLPPREGQQHTFVQGDDGQRYFVHLRSLRKDIERHRIQYNDRVEFETETSYDRRKQAYSLEVKSLRKCR